MSEPRPLRWRMVAAGTLAAAAIVLCGGLVAIATGGTDGVGGSSTFDSTGGFSDGLSGGFTDGLSGGFGTDSTPTGGAVAGPGGSKRGVSALWTGVGIGAIAVLIGASVVLLRRSRPPEATDEGPDFWSEKNAPEPPDDGPRAGAER